MVLFMAITVSAVALDTKDKMCIVLNGIELNKYFHSLNLNEIVCFVLIYLSKLFFLLFYHTGSSVDIILI